MLVEVPVTGQFVRPEADGAAAAHAVATQAVDMPIHCMAAATAATNAAAIAANMGAEAGLVDWQGQGQCSYDGLAGVQLLQQDCVLLLLLTATTSHQVLHQQPFTAAI